MSYTLSVVIPCFNEASTIERLIKLVRNAAVENIQIIVVDDASTDGTAEIIENTLINHVDKFVKHTKNQGKGAAIRSGITHVTGDYVIIQDADLEYNPSEYPKLLTPILEYGADVVYGSRFSGGEINRVLFFWHSVGNKLLTLLCNMFSDVNLTDMETCYKLFRSEIIKNITLRENRFGFEPEITLKIARIPNIKIYEVSISYFARTYSEGKKIDWKDGVGALFCIVKYGLLKMT